MNPTTGRAPRPATVALTSWPRAAVALLLALFLATLLTLTQSPAARADGDPADDVVRSLDVAIDLAADGTASVTETYQWDFGTRNGLGFYRVLISAMGYDPDPDKLRTYLYSDYAVTSPSGAPAEVWVERNTGSEIWLSVGAPDGSSDTRTGVQTYVLTYQLEGTLNAIRGQSDVPDQDEFYWNIFTDFEVPFDQVNVTVTGPAAVTNQACYQGPLTGNTPCASATANGNSASFSGTAIAAREGFTVVAAWAPGTFTNTDPILIDKPESQGEANFQILLQRFPWLEKVRDVWNFTSEHAPAITGGILALAGLFGAVRVARGRDQMYDGVPPGTLEQPGAPVKTVTTPPAVAVRFTPPEGLTPGQASVLMAEQASVDALSATMIDLAVRGFLTIRVEGTTMFRKRPNNWRLTRVPDAPRGELLPHEEGLMSSLFGGSKSVTTRGLSGSFSSRVRRFQRQLTRDSDERGWFRRPGLVTVGKPRQDWTVSRVIFGLISILVRVVFIGMVVVAFFGVPRILFGFSPEPNTNILQMIPWRIVAVVAAALFAFPVVRRLTAKAAHGRSAEGRALYDQLRGFKEYIATADADQIRWEEGQDIFSKYLPWAMVFGEAERWSSVFEKLAEEGRYTPNLYWYSGSDFRDVDSFREVNRSVSNFSSSGMSSLTYTPSTSGSSGGSGFSSSSGGGGGGGSSGGGGGGGGGGGR